MLTVFIVDDETPIREEIKSLDWAAVHATVIGEAPNGRSALERCRILSPDIVLVDIEMPVMDGLTFTEHLKQILPDVQVIFLTCHQDFSYAKMGISPGNCGVCNKKPLYGRRFVSLNRKSLPKAAGGW
ncbi:MAG: response regulator [Eisenbergiella massiliensis]